MNHTAGDDFEARVREILESNISPVQQEAQPQLIEALHIAIRQAIAQCPALVDEGYDMFSSNPELSIMPQARNELRATLRRELGLEGQTVS